MSTMTFKKVIYYRDFFMLFIICLRIFRPKYVDILRSNTKPCISHCGNIFPYFIVSEITHYFLTSRIYEWIWRESMPTFTTSRSNNIYVTLWIISYNSVRIFLN